MTILANHNIISISHTDWIQKGIYFFVFFSAVNNCCYVCSFISKVWPNVLINSSRKRSSNRWNLKAPSFRFRVDGKHFENGAFRQRCSQDNHVISLPWFSSNSNPKLPVIVAFLNFSGVVWSENIRCVFRVKPPFSNSSGVMGTGPQGTENFQSKWGS